MDELTLSGTLYPWVDVWMEDGFENGSDTPIEEERVAIVRMSRVPCIGESVSIFTGFYPHPVKSVEHYAYGYMVDGKHVSAAIYIPCDTDGYTREALKEMYKRGLAKARTIQTAIGSATEGSGS